MEKYVIMPLLRHSPSFRPPFMPGYGCYFCGDPGYSGAQGICVRCRSVIMPLSDRCRICRRLLPRRQDGSPRVMVCRDCLVLPPVFAGVTAVGPYTGLLQWAVTRFKFHGEMYLARPLAASLRRRVDGDRVRVDGVTAVPMDRRRLAGRGFNQAALLAQVLAFALQRPLWSLLRRTAGPPQVSLGQAARWQAVEEAFHILKGRSLDAPRILLVDDVMTTGATLRSCARILLQAGAASVWCAVAADAPRHAVRSYQGTI
ncbi:MAG: ComF family protein [Thermaerobacterales bacterium]